MQGKAALASLLLALAGLTLLAGGTRSLQPLRVELTQLNSTPLESYVQTEGQTLRLSGGRVFLCQEQFCIRAFASTRLSRVLRGNRTFEVQGLVREYEGKRQLLVVNAEEK